MEACLQASIAMLALISFFVLVWMAVPTEQSLTAKFPNVVVLGGFGSVGLDPISHDNSSMPAVTAEQVVSLNGFYQFDPLFYHKSMDRFINWEDRGKSIIYSCTLFCSPLNTTGEEVRLALVHYKQDEKKNLWYLVEMRNDDADSPIIYARSKFRKTPTYRSPWSTVTPGGELKPKDLPDVHMWSAWDWFRFDTPVKWAVTAGIIGASVLFFRWCRDDD